VRAPLPYDYTTKATACLVTGDGDHMPVKADVNASTSGVLRSACSVEEVAKAAGIKLPRLTVSGAGGQRVSPITNATAGVGEFEALRGYILRRVANADYGLRLFQLARIVAHATVTQAMGTRGMVADALASLQCRSILVSQSPLLTQAEFAGHSFWYIAAESDARYRAFLAMGAVGLERFADPHTVYSQLRVGAEVADTAKVPVVFVRVGELTGGASPNAGHYQDVLSSPDLCLSYYLSYANSLGIGDAALYVLHQVCVLPHLVGADVRLPYKPDYPCLDAAPYLLSPGSLLKTAGPVDVRELVASAAVRAQQLLVGLGARIGCFPNSVAVDHRQVIQQAMLALSDHQSARHYSREVLEAFGDGESGLEWISPFFPDLGVGVAAAMAAYHDRAWLMSTSLRPVCLALEGVFDVGVDMHAALFVGTRARGRLREALIMQLLSRTPATSFCDALTRATVPAAVAARYGYVRAWRANCRFVRYCVNERKPSPRASTVVSPQPRASVLRFLRRRSSGASLAPGDSVSVALAGRSTPLTDRGLGRHVRSPPRVRARHVRALSLTSWAADPQAPLQPSLAGTSGFTREADPDEPEETLVGGPLGPDDPPGSRGPTRSWAAIVAENIPPDDDDGSSGSTVRTVVGENGAASL